MKMIGQFGVFFIVFMMGSGLSAQIDSTWQEKPALRISGFADVFYTYDFNQPNEAQRQPFLFNHNRHNEFNLNVGLLKFEVKHAKYRSNIALQTGTYASDNYAAEPVVLRNIFEANIGISLNDKNNLWLDAGVLPSHLGFESAISMDNFTLTRSLSAESSPYFLTGAKLTYNPNDKLEIAGLFVNGWQRIQRLEGNSTPSFGTQIVYKPNKKVSFNWSTFIGTDDPDVSKRMRYFNNIFAQFQATDKLNFITGFDFGAQQKSKGSSDYNTWLSPTIIGQYTINKVWKTALRIEYYQDKTGVIIPTGTTNGFQTTGYSLNMDYAPNQNIMCRLEGRLLNSKDPIFEAQTNLTDSNFIIAASIAIKFSALLRE